MLKEEQKVKVKWNSYTKAYYVSKGYVYTKMGDEFFVDIKDLQKGSHSKVIVICDFCGEEYTKVYKDYFAQHIDGDCCKNCEGKKSLKVSEEKYGKGCRGRLLKQICLERYGVDNAAKSPEIFAKLKNTNIKRYGKPTALMLPQNREKCKEAIHNPEVMKKRIRTNLSRYGYEHGLSAPEVRHKIAQSLCKNGNVPTSSQQLMLYNLLKSMYPECYLNFPCGRYSLDCMVVIDTTKIDVEYDGYFWHLGKQESDSRRDVYVQSEGYKVLRILGKYDVPSLQEIQDKINLLLTTDQNIIRISTI